jgi:hypothetical protein
MSLLHQPHGGGGRHGDHARGAHGDADVASGRHREVAELAAEGRHDRGALGYHERRAPSTARRDGLCHWAARFTFVTKAREGSRRSEHFSALHRLLLRGGLGTGGFVLLPRRHATCPAGRRVSAKVCAQRRTVDNGIAEGSHVSSRREDQHTQTSERPR